jgi:hypothetical protein
MSVLENVLIGEHRHLGYGLGSALTAPRGCRLGRSGLFSLRKPAIRRTAAS